MQAWQYMCLIRGGERERVVYMKYCVYSSNIVYSYDMHRINFNFIDEANIAHMHRINFNFIDEAIF